MLKKVVSEKENFINLSIYEQAVVLNDLVQYIGGSKYVNLKLINGAEKAGGITIGKNITNYNISLVCQSISGIYQREIRF